MDPAHPRALSERGARRRAADCSARALRQWAQRVSLFSLRRFCSSATTNFWQLMFAIAGGLFGSGGGTSSSMMGGSTSGGLFGSKPATGGGLFGGSSNKPAGGMFGGGSSSSGMSGGGLFGAKPAASTGGLFGGGGMASQPKSTFSGAQPGLFGGQSTGQSPFGSAVQANLQNGTASIEFNGIKDKDHGGDAKNLITLTSITADPSY